MPDQIIPINQLDRSGVILDNPPVSLPPNAFTNARNVRFKDGAVRKMEGEVDIFEGVSEFFDRPDIGQLQYVAWWPSPNQTTRDRGYYIFVVEVFTDAGTIEHHVYAMLPGADSNNSATFRDITPFTELTIFDNRGVSAGTPSFLFTTGVVGQETAIDVIRRGLTDGTLRGRIGGTVYPASRFRLAELDSQLLFLDVNDNPTDYPGTSADIFIAQPVGYSNQGRWQHTLFNGGFTFIINNGVERPQYITDPEGNIDIGRLGLSDLPGWDSYQVNELVLRDTFNSETDTRVFDTGQTIMTGVTRYVVQVRRPGITDPITIVQGTGYTLDTNGELDVITFADDTGSDPARPFLLSGDELTVNFQSVNPVETRAAIVRSFGDFLVAGNLVERDTVTAGNPIIRRLTGIVRSSDVAPPGSIPNNWNPFAAGVSTADEFVIADTGTVQDMVPLQGNLYLYTNSSISVMRLTGNAQVPLTVQPVTDQYGTLTTDAVLEYDGKHFVIGSDDIYLFGGHPGSIQSISDQKVRRSFFGRVNPINDNTRNLFTLRYAARDEIWICFPTVNSVRGECNEAFIWNYRAGSWTIRTLNNVIRGDIGPVPGGGVPSAIINFNGESGTNGIARIGSLEVQSYDLDSTSSVGQIDNPRSEVRSLQVLDDFVSEGDTITRTELRASAPSLIETTIGEDFYAGPDERPAVYNLELPNGTFSSNTASDGSPEELQFGGAKLDFQYAANDVSNPVDNPPSSIAISANQLYDAAGVEISGNGTGDTNGVYQDTNIEIDSLEVNGDGETFTGTSANASGSNPHAFNNVTFTSSNNVPVTGTGTATRINNAASGTNVVTVADAPGSFPFTASGNGDATVNYTPTGVALNNVVVDYTNETQAARSVNVNQNTGTLTFGSRQTSYTGSVAVTDGGSFPFSGSGSGNQANRPSTFNATGQSNGTVSANVAAGTTVVPGDLVAFPGQPLDPTFRVDDGPFGGRNVRGVCRSSNNATWAGYFGGRDMPNVNNPGFRMQIIHAFPENNPPGFGLCVGTGGGGQPAFTYRGRTRTAANSLPTRNEVLRGFRVMEWSNAGFDPITGTSYGVQMFVGVRGGTDIAIISVGYNNGSTRPAFQIPRDTTIPNAGSTTTNTVALTSVTNNTNGVITLNWEGQNITVQPNGGTGSAPAVVGTNLNWSWSGNAAGRTFTNNTSYPLNFTGGGISLPAIPIGGSQTAATRRTDWSSTIQVAESQGRRFNITNNNTEYPITFTPQGGSGITVNAGSTVNSGVLVGTNDTRWATTGSARQLQWTNTGSFPLQQFSATTSVNNAAGTSRVIDATLTPNETTAGHNTRIRNWSAMTAGTTLTNSNANGNLVVTHEPQGDGSTTTTINNGNSAFFVNAMNNFSYTGTRFWNNRTLNQSYTTRTGAPGVTTTGSPIVFTNNTGFTLYYFNPAGLGVDIDNPHLAPGESVTTTQSSTNWTALDHRPANDQTIVSAVKRGGLPVDNFVLDVTSESGEVLHLDDLAPFEDGELESVIFDGHPSSYTWTFTGDQRLTGTAPAPTPRNAVPTSDFARRAIAAINADEVPQLANWTASMGANNRTITLTSDIPGRRLFNTTSQNFETYVAAPTTITTGVRTGTQTIFDNNNIALFTVTVTGTGPYNYVVTTTRNTGFFDSDTIRHLEIRSGGQSFLAPTIEFNRDSDPFTFTSTSNQWTVVEAPDSPVPTYTRIVNGVLDEMGTALGTTNFTQAHPGVGILNSDTITREPLQFQFMVNFTDDTIDDINFIYEWPEDVDPTAGPSISNTQAITFLVDALRTGTTSNGRIVSNTGFSNINQYFRILDTDGTLPDGSDADNTLLANQFEIEARGYEGEPSVTFGDGTTGIFPMLDMVAERVIHDGGLGMDPYGGAADVTFGTRAAGIPSGVRPPVVSGVTGLQVPTADGFDFELVEGDHVSYSYVITGTHEAGPPGAATIAAITDNFYNNVRNVDNSRIWNSVQGTGANADTVTITSVVPSAHENTIAVSDPDNGLAADGTNSVGFFSQALTTRGIRSLPAGVAAVYPQLQITSPENVTDVITLDASAGDLNAAAIIDLIEARFSDDTHPFTGWDVQVTADGTTLVGTPPTQTNRVKFNRLDSTVITGEWSFRILSYGNTGTTFPVGTPGNPPHTISGSEGMNSFSRVTGDTNFDARGTPPIRTIPTYILIRISNDSIEGGIQYIPFVFGDDSTYQELPQTGTQGTRVDANTAVGRIIAGIERVNRSVVVRREGTRLTILPTQYSELANFVVGITTNETAEGVIEWNQFVTSQAFIDQHTETYESGTTSLGRVPWVIPTDASIPQGGRQSIPDPLIPVMAGQPGSPPIDTQAIPRSDRRPDRTSRSMLADFSTGTPTVDQMFDPLRPWPTTQVNLNREYPIFVTTQVASAAENFRLTQHFRGADIGFLFLDQPYESFVERIELAMTPEFDTEQLQSLAIWGDGGSLVTFGEEIDQATLAIKMYGTNAPGETLGVFRNGMQNTVGNNFIIGEDYKVDMRIHGRFINLLITDYMIVDNERVPNPANMGTDATLNTPRGISWNLSGMQAEIIKGGRR